MNKIESNIKKNKGFSAYSRIIQLILFIIFIDLLFLPYAGSTIDNSPQTSLKEKIVSINQSFTVLAKENDLELEAVEPVIDVATESKEEEREVAWSKRYAMTAYNSEVAQCDDSPCITANGFNVCEHGIEDTVAANFLKFGTEIRIPELFGDRILIVRDRMNSRYTERVDVWLLSHDNAIDFGVKYPMIEVLK